MKKLLACSVAAILAASMLTACGGDDDSEGGNDTASTTAATTSAAEESSEAEEDSSEAEESEAEESEAEGEDSEAEGEGEGEEGGEEGEGPVDISNMPSTLQNQETASLTFDASKTPDDYFVTPFAELDYTNDESQVEMSIEEVEGIPMLRVQVLDKNDAGTNYKIPKIQFDMSKLFEGQTDKLADIMTVDIEFMTKAEGMFTGDDGSEALVPGNFMGSIAAKVGADLKWKEINSDIGEGEWVSEWATYVETGRVGIMGPFEAIDDPQYLCFMRWGIPNQADFYIVNITFYDADGNVMETSLS